MEHEIDSLNTLPHLTNEIVRSAKKTKLCAFSVAIEGWRRGLTLKWYTKDSEQFQDMIVFGVNPPGRLFSLSSEERTHYFFRTRGDKVTNEAVIIGSDKDKTKEYLINNGVPSPIGKMFTTESSVDDIIDTVEQTKGLKYPLVVKPVDGSLGMGVVTNIKNRDALRRAVNYVREVLRYEEIIVEKHIQGKEYRIYVVGDKAVAAYNRVPANIIGCVPSGALATNRTSKCRVGTPSEHVTGCTSRCTGSGSSDRPSIPDSSVASRRAAAKSEVSSGSQ